MFKNVKIQNLRGVTDLEVSNLGQVNLFVGQNNCGKTTLLEGIFFLVGATNPQLPISTNTFRGLNYLQNEYLATFFNNMHSDSNINLSAEMTEKYKRSLTIRSITESGEFHRGTEVGNGISTSPENGDSEPNIRLRGLEFIYQNSNLQEPHISKILLSEEGLKPEGRTEGDIKGIFVSPSTRFDWKARFDSVQRRKKEKELFKFLSEIDSSFVDIRLNAIGILEADVGLECRIPVNLMGGGIASCLSVVLAMLDTNDGIVLIDEFETGLHHSTQEKLWRGVFKWAEKFNVQVFVTTHSYECINAFVKCSKENLFKNKSKLYRIERQKDGFQSVELGIDDLEISLENKWEIR